MDNNAVTTSFAPGILIAAPELKDPNFHQSVVLMVEHNEKGAFGVVINRAGMGNDGVLAYCQEKRIQVLTEIPDDRRIAEAYSSGSLICESLSEYRPLFESLLAKISRHGPTELADCVSTQITQGSVERGSKR